MKTRKSYYVSLKNAFTWLSAMLIAASCAWSIIYSGTEYGNGLWFGTILPVICSVLYIVTLLVGAKRQVYKVAVPAILFLIVLALRMLFRGRSFPFGYMALYLLISLLFLKTISGKILGRRWLIAIFIIPLVAVIGEVRFAGRDAAIVMPEILAFSALLSLTFALRRHADDGTYYPTWGDRVDGRKIRSLSPMFYIVPYIMKTRNTADNLITDSIESTKADAYIRRKRKEGLTGFGMTHVILATYVRTISQYPGLNRFVNGQKIFARYDIQINMAIKKEMSTQGGETLVKMFFKPTDTADDVYSIVKESFEEAKKPVLDSSFDNTARVLNYIPGLLLRFAIGLLTFLDYFGLLPLWLMHVSPFHGSFFITSMASLGIPPIYHHLYDFGNVPVFCAFGIKRHVNEVVDDGKVAKRQYVDYTFETDERICDGFYYASALKYFKKLMANPDQLDTPPKEVVRDID